MAKSKVDQAKFEEFLEEFKTEEEALDQLLRWKCLTDLYYLGSEVLGMGRAKRMGDPLLDPTHRQFITNIFLPVRPRRHRLRK